jgi:hypothetical protein
MRLIIFFSTCFDAVIIVKVTLLKPLHFLNFQRTHHRQQFSILSSVCCDSYRYTPTGRMNVKVSLVVGMALEWCKFVDSKTIFPKLPVYLLRAYFDRYVRNDRRVQDAVSPA